MPFDITQVYHIAGNIVFGSVSATIPTLNIANTTIVSIDQSYLGTTLIDTVTDAQKTATGVTNANNVFYIKPSINLYTLFNTITGRAPYAGEHIQFTIADNIAVVGFTSISGSNNAVIGTTQGAAITVGAGWLADNVVTLVNNGLILGGGGNGAYNNVDYTGNSTTMSTPGSTGIVNDHASITLNVTVNIGGFVSGGGGGGGNAGTGYAGFAPGGGGAPYGYALPNTTKGVTSVATDGTKAKPGSLLSGGNGYSTFDGVSVIGGYLVYGGVGGNPGATGADGVTSPTNEYFYIQGVHGAAGGARSSGLVTFA